LEAPVEEGLARGKVDFELTGMKLRGRFALVRMKGPGKEKDWLLFKKGDAHASPGAARDPVRDAPRSVLSGLTVDELGSRARIGSDLEARAAGLGAPVRLLDASRLVPMPCALSGAPVAAPGWIYELKLDGVRAIAVKEDGRVTLRGRKLRDVTAAYPEIARAVLALPPERVVLDGEILAFDIGGKPSFHRLAQRIHLEKPHEVRLAALEIPVVFAAFDLLAVGDRDTSDLPLSARKSLLSALLPAPGVVRAVDHVEGDAGPLLAFCEEHDLEGVVAKRASSPYRPGPRRSGDWVKMKRKRDEDLIVVGYTRGTGKRQRLGAIDVASFEDGVLQNRGKIGSGFDDGQIDLLLERLAGKEVEGPVAEGDMVPAPRGRIHVRPEVVVRVRHDGFSDDGQVLHGVYLGIRDDVEASPPSRPHPRPDEGEGGEEEGRGGAPPEPPAFAITNPRKVLWPGEGITKADLVRYYEAIAPALLPYLSDRPVMLVRYPDGILGKSFYQWNVPVGTPGWIRTYRLPGVQDQPVEVFLVDDERTLLHVANLAAIPIHILASRASSPDDCDFLTMDFDVKGASLAEGITLARSLRDLCASIGIEGFAKTSGQSGLHVLVPLGPGVGYPTARAMADLLGRMLCDRHPDIATMERIVAKRGPRVYVDTGQTGPTRTIVAPWSVRARPGATVSVPLAWSEVAPGLDPAAFTLHAALERFQAVGDPMSGLLAARPDVPAAVERLGSMIQEERRRGG
jgi:bifunctional non-homologous end joining protein LigD